MWVADEPRRPAETTSLRASIPVVLHSCEPQGGYLTGCKHRSNRDVELLPGIEPDQIGERRQPCSTGEPADKLCQRQGAEIDAECRVNRPDPRAGNGINSQAGVLAERARGIPQPRLISRFEIEPSAHELLHTGRDPPGIGKDRFQADRRAGEMGEMPRVIGEQFVADAQPAGLVAGTQADEAGEHGAEAIASRHLPMIPRRRGAALSDPLPLGRQAVLAPGPVEERRGPVGEDIEEVTQGRIVEGAQTPCDELGVVSGKDSRRTDQAEGCHLQLERDTLLLVAIRCRFRHESSGSRDRPPRKTEGCGGLETDRVPGACACVLAPQLRGQGATVPDGVPQGLSLEQPDSLEQLESLRAVEEPLGQARTRLPALGGHRHSSRRLSLCFDAATSRVNELSVTHEPRNRSMTLAKRKAAPSANRSSSSSSRTSRPRQTPPSGPGTRPATRRLDVPISPCTHCDF